MLVGTASLVMGQLTRAAIYGTSTMMQRKAAPLQLAAGDWLPSQAETRHQTPWWTKASLDSSMTLVTTGKGYHVSNYLAEGPSE
jgi:hypothetical protein